MGMKEAPSPNGNDFSTRRVWIAAASMLAAKVAFDVGSALREQQNKPPVKPTPVVINKRHVQDLNTLPVGSSLIGRPFTIKGLTENEPPIQVLIEKGEDGKLIVSANEKNFCIEDPVFMFQTIEAAIDDLTVAEHGGVDLTSQKNGNAKSSLNEMQRVLHRLHAHQRSEDAYGKKVEERIAANFTPNNDVVQGIKNMAGSAMIDADGVERYLVTLTRLDDTQKRENIPLAVTIKNTP